MDEYDNAIA